MHQAAICGKFIPAESFPEQQSALLAFKIKGLIRAIYSLDLFAFIFLKVFLLAHPSLPVPGQPRPNIVFACDIVIIK